MTGPTYRPVVIDEWLPRLHELLTERPDLATTGVGGTILAAVLSS